MPTTEKILLTYNTVVLTVIAVLMLYLVYTISAKASTAQSFITQLIDAVMAAITVKRIKDKPKESPSKKESIKKQI